MVTKQKTIVEIAKERSFESIFEEQNKLKIQRSTIENDIDELVGKRNILTSKIGKLGRIAAEKRRSIVNKK
jgi:hypothetical protein